jgi:DNA-binding response OmpR family regulator
MARQASCKQYGVMTNESFLQGDEPDGAPPRRETNRRQRILVVDDDAAIRGLNTEVLTYSGYNVDAVADGVAAWETLQLNNYDLMVTDNVMPRMSGVELIRRLQAARMPLPVIMATGAVPDDEFIRYELLQPAMTLIKPYSFDELLEAVKAVLFASNAGREEGAPPPNWSPTAGQQLRL